MTPEEFVYWLQGYFEISQNKVLDEKGIRIILSKIHDVIDRLHPNDPRRQIPVDLFNFPPTGIISHQQYLNRIRGQLATSRDP